MARARVSNDIKDAASKMCKLAACTGDPDSASHDGLYLARHTLSAVRCNTSISIWHLPYFVILPMATQISVMHAGLHVTAGVADMATSQLQHLSQTSNSCNSTAELYIITPVSRFKLKEDLARLSVSIRFDCIVSWILVYDTSVQNDLEPQFADNPQVIEVYYHSKEEAAFGGTQRNKGMEKVTQGLLHFLDDDNIMHPHFWDILSNISLGRLTTFDQVRMEDNPPRILGGSVVKVGCIDTGMFVVDRVLIADTKWNATAFNTDGVFAEEIAMKHPDKHAYIPEVAAYHHGLVIYEN